MREIKFRAWSNRWDKMVYPDDKEIKLHIANGGNVHSLWLDAIDEEGVEIMQYTGLTVKAEKELYYGDIVKHNDNVFVVCFRENFGFCLIHVKLYDPTNKMLMQKDNWRSYEDVWRMRKYVEVIGNIYETPIPKD